MTEKIIIDRMDAEEFFRTLIDDANRIGRYPHLDTEQILRNIARDFQELCGGKAATEDWEA